MTDCRQSWGRIIVTVVAADRGHCNSGAEKCVACVRAPASVQIAVLMAACMRIIDSFRCREFWFDIPLFACENP